MYIPKLLHNTRKTDPKTSKHFQKVINNRSEMSPGAPPETPRAIDLFLKHFVMRFGAKIDSKMEPKTIQQVCFCCLLFRYRFSSIVERKVITVGVLFKLALINFGTFVNHENDAAV